MSLSTYFTQLFCKHDDRAIARSLDNRSVLSKCKKCGRLLEFEKFLNIEYSISEKTFKTERGRWLDIPPPIPPISNKFFDQALIDIAKTRLVHDGSGQKREIPTNSSKRVEFRRYEMIASKDQDNPSVDQKRDLAHKLKNVHSSTDGYTLVSLCNEAAVEIERLQRTQKITGSTSDGYHTFDELYRHRGILFALICADHKEIAWKSKKHHDGTMYDGMFLCGIDTPYGQATYHMDLEPFWNMIKVRELETAPEWDGHTPDMALNRIAAMAMDRFIPIEKGVLEE